MERGTGHPPGGAFSGSLFEHVLRNHFGNAFYVSGRSSLRAELGWGSECFAVIISAAHSTSRRQTHVLHQWIFSVGTRPGFSRDFGSWQADLLRTPLRDLMQKTFPAFSQLFLSATRPSIHCLRTLLAFLRGLRSLVSKSPLLKPRNSPLFIDGTCSPCPSLGNRCPSAALFFQRFPRIEFPWHVWTVSLTCLEAKHITLFAVIYLSLIFIGKWYYFQPNKVKTRGSIPVLPDIVWKSLKTSCNL